MVYPYSFVRSQTSVPEASDIIRRYYYRFVSSLSRKEYRVFIDLCPNNIYIIKFYLKQDEKRKDKYNVLSGLNEPRNLVTTCLSILMNEFLDKDETASFGFVASNLPGEGKSNTKRFRFYRQMMANLIGDERFSHYIIQEDSIYLLVPNVLKDGKKDVLAHFIELKEHYGLIDYE